MVNQVWDWLEIASSKAAPPGKTELLLLNALADQKMSRRAKKAQSVMNAKEKYLTFPTIKSFTVAPLPDMPYPLLDMRDEICLNDIDTFMGHKKVRLPKVSSPLFLRFAIPRRHHLFLTRPFSSLSASPSPCLPKEQIAHALHRCRASTSRTASHTVAVAKTALFPSSAA